MFWLVEDFFNCTVFYNFTGIHDRNLICNTSHNTKVMRNKDSCEMIFLLQGFEQVNDLRLNRYIKGRCRLITDKNIRAASQGNSNNNPLTHTTWVLERIFFETFFRIWNPYLTHVVNGHFFSFFGWFSLVLDNDFCNLASNSIHRILENSRNFCTANWLPILITTKSCQIFAAVVNGSLGYTAIFF